MSAVFDYTPLTESARKGPGDVESNVRRRPKHPVMWEVSSYGVTFCTDTNWDVNLAVEAPG